MTEVEAYCSSKSCIVESLKQKYPHLNKSQIGHRAVYAERHTMGTRKDVSKYETFCPDCSFALYWSRPGARRLDIYQ